MTKADAARAIVDKFPNQSKKELGRVLYKLHPLLFKDAEDARDSVRRITGAHAGAGVTPTHKDIYMGLPKGEKNDFTPHILAPGSYGVLSDMHIPYHDLQAVEICIEYFLKRGIKKVILNGDTVDAYQLSHWQRDPSKRNFQGEAEMLKAFLKEVTKHFTITMKLGNHCERYEDFIMRKSPELYGMSVQTFEALISVEAEYDEQGRIGNIYSNNLLKKVTVIKNKRPIKAGKLNILHAHELPKGISSPVNPARGFYMKAKTNILGAHHHQTSEHIESDMNGKVTGAWSTGCLSDLHPNYAPINKWNTGACIVEHDGEEFEVENFKIINGKIK